MPWRRSGQALTTSPVSGLPTPQSSRRAATPCPSRLPTGNDSLQRPRGAQSGSRAQPAQQAAGRPGARLRPAARRRPEEPALAGQPGRAAPQPTAPAPTRRPAPCPPRPSHLEGRPLRLSRVPAGRPGHSRRAVSRGGSWTRQSGLACDRRRRPEDVDHHSDRGRTRLDGSESDVNGHPTTLLRAWLNPLKRPATAIPTG